MPRKQKPQSPGLEAGSAYGEVQQNIQAQEAIPLPQTNNLPAPVNQAPATPAPLPVEAAQAFTPQITPLLAPGAGGIGSPQMLAATPIVYFTSTEDEFYGNSKYVYQQGKKRGQLKVYKNFKDVFPIVYAIQKWDSYLKNDNFYIK